MKKVHEAVLFFFLINKPLSVVEFADTPCRFYQDIDILLQDGLSEREVAESEAVFCEAILRVLASVLGTDAIFFRTTSSIRIFHFLSTSRHATREV